jgi:hypothetical protein
MGSFISKQTFFPACAMAAFTRNAALSKSFSLPDQACFPSQHSHTQPED